MIPYLALPRPRLFAHRGASAVYPENTLPAFAAATAAGLAYLEMDVWATSDGVVVVHHDPTLQRLCGVSQPVSAVDFRTLQSYDAGWGFSRDNGTTFPQRGQGIVVPSLAAVLQHFPHARCNIEIKQAEPVIVANTVSTIKETGAEQRVLLAAENDRTMAVIRRECGSIPTSLSFAEAAAFFDWLTHGCRAPYTPPGVALQIPVNWQGRRLVSRESVAAAHAVGLEVHVWTVNDADQARELLDLGVDGIMGDIPELLLSVLS